MTITEFREQYPQYNNVDDDTLAKQLHAKHYANVPYQEFAARFMPAQQLRAPAMQVRDPSDVGPEDAPNDLKLTGLKVAKAVLGHVQDIGQATEEIPKQLAVGTLDTASGLLRAVQRRGMERPVPLDVMRAALPGVEIPDTPWEPPAISKIAGRMAENVEAEARAFKQKPAIGPVTRLTRPVVQNVPSFGLMVGATLLSGSPLAGLAVGGEVSGGQAFAEQLAADPDNARKANLVGDLVEFAEIAGEALVLPKIAGALTKGVPVRKAISLVVENATQEGATGYAQSFIQTMGKETSAGKSVAEAAKLAHEAGLRAIPESAWVGGVMGGAVGAVSARKANGEFAVPETTVPPKPVVPEAVAPELEVVEEPAVANALPKVDDMRPESTLLRNMWALVRDDVPGKPFIPTGEQFRSALVNRHIALYQAFDKAKPGGVLQRQLATDVYETIRALNELDGIADPADGRSFVPPEYTKAAGIKPSVLEPLSKKEAAVSELNEALAKVEEAARMKRIHEEDADTWLAERRARKPRYRVRATLGRETVTPVAKPMAAKKATPKAVTPKRLAPRQLKGMKRDIHRLARQGGLTIAQYRDRLEQVTGIRSVGDMSPEGLAAVKAQFEYDYGSLRPTDGVTLAGEPTTAGAVVDDVLAVAESLPPKKVEPATVGTTDTAIPGTLRQLWNFLTSYRYSKRMPAKILDGGNDDGPMSKVFHKNLERGRGVRDGYVTNVEQMDERARKANGVTDTRLAQMSPALNPRLRIHERLSPLTKRLMAVINGVKFEFTESRLLSLYLADMQVAKRADGKTVPIGRQHLLKHGFKFSRFGKGSGPLTAAQIDSLKARVDSDPHLTAVLRQYLDEEVPLQANAINSTAASIGRGPIADLPNWWGLEVEQPTRLPGKTVEVKESEKSGTPESGMDEGGKGFNVDPIENQRIFKNRTGGRGALIINDFFAQRSRQRAGIANFVGYAEPMRTARTVLNDPAVQQAYRSKGYGNELDLLGRLIARWQGSERSAGVPAWVRRTLGRFYQGITRNPSVLLIQVTSACNNFAVMDPAYAARGMKALAHTKQVRAEMLEHSPTFFQRYRGGAASMEMAEAMESDMLYRSVTGKDSHGSVGAGLLRNGDSSPLTALWEGVKAEFDGVKDGTIEQNPYSLTWKWWADKDVDSVEPGSTPYWQLIEDRFQDLVQKSQPSWDPANRSMLTGDPDAMRRSVFGLFRSFSDKCAEMVADARMDYSTSDKSLQAKQLYVRRLASVCASFWSAYAIKELLRAGLRRDLREPWEYAVGTATAPLSMFPVIDDAMMEGTRLLVGTVIGNKMQVRSFGTFESPYLDLGNQVVNGTKNIAVSIGNVLEGDTKEAKKSAAAAAKALLEPIGLYLFGLPTATLSAVAKGPEEEKKAPERIRR